MMLCKLLQSVLLVVFGLLLMASMASSSDSSHSSLRHSNNRELDKNDCLDHLKTVANGSNQVTAVEFLDFLSLQSGGFVNYTFFSQVPLDLRLLFYATACSGGRDCTTQEPTITLNAKGMASTLLQIFCVQIQEIVTQPDTLQVSFSYSIYYQNDLTPQELMIQQDESTIVSSLQTATEQVVHMALGCLVQDSARRRLRLDGSASYQVQPLYVNQSQTLTSILTSEEMKYCSRKVESLRHLQEECEYTVKAVIDDLFPYDCDPPAPSDDIQCAIVATSVFVMKEQIMTNEERIELRTTIMTALSDSIASGSFKDHLP